MRILVTGGLGFQGQYLVRALRERGDDVLVLEVPSNTKLLTAAAMHVPVVWGSVTMTGLLAQLAQGRDVVVHLGAITNPERAQSDPFLATRVNVAGTQAVLEACRAANVRLVHASTCEVYGQPQMPGALQDEHSAFRPPHIYGASKAAADLLVQAYRKSYGLDAVTLRPCNVFGPWQKQGVYGAVIPTMTKAALSGGPIMVYGGTQRREFLYIDDVVRAYLSVIDKPLGPADPRIFNITSGESRSMRDLALALASQIGNVTVTTMPPRVAEPSGFCLDGSLFESVYNWSARTSFDDGLQRYIRWAVGGGNA